MSMNKIKKNGMEIQFDERTLAFSFKKEGQAVWTWEADYAPYMECGNEKLYFRDALEISHEPFRSGVGEGILSTYSGFKKEGKIVPYKFQTIVWVEGATGDVYCEWIHQQGCLFRYMEVELDPPSLRDFLEQQGHICPGLLNERQRGYLAVCVTPWIAGYQAEHPAGGPYTRVSMRFEPSLGRMDYRRIVKYTFLNNCDYNDICKAYRDYVNEQGRLRTLEEKAVRNPSVNDLIGCAFLHKGIKTFVQPDSDSMTRRIREKQSFNNICPKREGNQEVS